MYYSTKQHNSKVCVLFIFHFLCLFVCLNFGSMSDSVRFIFICISLLHRMRKNCVAVFFSNRSIFLSSNSHPNCIFFHFWIWFLKMFSFMLLKSSNNLFLVVQILYFYYSLFIPLCSKMTNAIVYKRKQVYEFDMIWYPFYFEQY